MSELTTSPPQVDCQICVQPAISVLVVDDQPIAAKSIRQLLASAPEMVIHYCQDPTLALATAVDVAPSVILQDLVMPDVDGLILVKFFRAHPTTRNTPIIMLSSKGDPEVKAAAFSMGANDYLVKLPDPIELIARLRYHAAAYQNLLRRYEAEQTLAYSRRLEKQVEGRTAELKQALDTLKQAQAKLIHTEKMSSMGQLVAGIAHEVNNPINFIYGNLNYINGYVEDLLALIRAYQQQYPSPPPPVSEKLEELDLEFTSPDLLQSFNSLRTGAKRIRDLVLNLRNFSRFDEAAIKTVNLHEGIDSTLAMLAPDLEGIVVEKEYGDLPLVECYASQLNQVFMHLIRNALDVLNSPADRTTDKSPLLHISTAIAPKNRVAVWIADNGPGILPEIQERIFDPFFTTKAVGKGTGLGLSISYQIVTGQHEGKLKCYSVPGQGAKFLIELPIHLASAKSGAEPPQLEPVQVLQSQSSSAGDLA